MRNIDYAALYQQVLEAERKGTWDGLTQDERTKREIAGNKARTISVNQAKVGKVQVRRVLHPQHLLTWLKSTLMVQLTSSLLMAWQLTMRVLWQ